MTDRDITIAILEGIVGELKSHNELSDQLAPFKKGDEPDTETLARILYQYLDSRDKGGPIRGGKYRGIKGHWELCKGGVPGRWCNYCSRDKQMTEFYQYVYSPLYVDRMCKLCFEEHFSQDDIE
jgi:hypothetical protein